MAPNVPNPPERDDVPFDKTNPLHDATSLDKTDPPDEAEASSNGNGLDKTNPLTGPVPVALGPSVWGLAVGEAGGSIVVEHKATAACSPMLPDVTRCSLVLPRAHADLTKQSQLFRGHMVGVALPPGVLPPQRPWLPPRQVRAARLLLAGLGVCEVARAVGVCRHTISRWVKNPAFQAETQRHAAAAVPLAGGRRAKAGAKDAARPCPY